MNIDVSKIVKFADSREIELSPVNCGAFKGNDGFYHMPVYSTFRDKARQKIKNN